MEEKDYKEAYFLVAGYRRSFWVFVLCFTLLFAAYSAKAWSKQDWKWLCGELMPKRTATLSWEQPEGEQVDGFKIYVYYLIDQIQVMPGHVRELEVEIPERGQTCFKISAYNDVAESLSEEEICLGMRPVSGLRITD